MSDNNKKQIQIEFRNIVSAWSESMDAEEFQGGTIDTPPIQ
jgi:hypothetical protein